MLNILQEAYPQAPPELISPEQIWGKVFMRAGVKRKLRHGHTNNSSTTSPRTKRAEFGNALALLASFFQRTNENVLH